MLIIFRLRKIQREAKRCPQQNSLNILSWFHCKNENILTLLLNFSGEKCIKLDI